MTEIERKVLERSPEGGYQFTKYGEFLSYYHAHLQIFNKMIDAKNLPEAEKRQIKESIKNFMKSHIKQTDHFFHYTRDFAGFLQITQEDLTAYMNKNFLEVLHKVQDKLKQQELENVAKTRQFSTLTEEIVATLGELFPPDHRFISQDDLIVIENIKTGEITKPQGILSIIKEEREREEEKKRQIQLQLQRLREKPEETFADEVSILKEIVQEFGTITDSPLELKEEILPIKPQVIVQREEKKEKGLLDDVEDLEIESEESIQAVDEEEKDEESENYDSEEQVQDNSLGDFLDSLESQEELPEPDEADRFLYKNYLEIAKIIQGFKNKNDIQGYNEWLKTAEPVAKVFNSIKTNLAKEKSGQSIFWEDFFKTMEIKTGLQIPTLKKLKARIEHLDRVKLFLDKCIHELKKQPPQVLNFLKVAWPKISEAFGKSPHYAQVEKEIAEILKSSPNESVKKPIEKIINQAIEILKREKV